MIQIIELRGKSKAFLQPLSFRFREYRFLLSLLTLTLFKKGRKLYVGFAKAFVQFPF